MEANGFEAFASRWHPFDALDAEKLASLSGKITSRRVSQGETIYAAGDRIGVFSLIGEGSIDLVSREGTLISQLREGDYFGAIALLGEGLAVHAVEAAGDVLLYEMQGHDFLDLIETEPAVSAFFRRTGKRTAASAEPLQQSAEGWLSMPLSALMSSPAFTCPGTLPLKEAAARMHEKRFSCLLVAGPDDRLEGILTTRDMTAFIARDVSGATPISQVMTPDPIALDPSKTGFDAVLTMSERGIGHLPVVENGIIRGILTQTDMVRRHTVSAVTMIRDIAQRDTYEGLSEVTAQIPVLLAHLVGSGAPAHRIGHMITSISDAVTRRLITLAEAELGPAPVSWLWLACGSQGRREQTGVSDQDNCIIIADDYDETLHRPWFEAFAKYVSDGLNATGYVYCPGDMMATNPRWCQPLKVWRGYFEKWIRVPDPMAQMLASVMFDLRPISGDESLFSGLQTATLEMARADSIFRAHMVSNSLKHTPPLGLFRGFALIRGGEHKDTIDLKHSGVVPVVDLGRLYALQGAIECVNTRERLEAAIEKKVLSASGGADLIDAYDLIAMIRLQHQARQIREGEKPDNFMRPSRLSALERNHLKDAFGVIKGLQSSLGYGRG